MEKHPLPVSLKYGYTGIAFLFVDFLYRNQRLLNKRGEPIVNEMGLTTLTLLVAESAADHKETMIRLIMTMLTSWRLGVM